MIITRRDFLKYCGLSAISLGLQASDLAKIEKVFASPTAPAVIWLTGSCDCGCSISLLNRIASSSPKAVDDLLVNSINLIFHVNLMAATGDAAVKAIRDQTGGNYILVVEGGVPRAFNGAACIVWTENNQEVSFAQALSSLAAGADKIVCVGACASFGGIGAAGPNPSNLISVPNFLRTATINIPGCPAHPDWIIWTIVQLLTATPIALDSYRRPTKIYGRTVHSRCPLRETDEAKTFGIANRCLKELGCRGPETYANCPSVRWNNGVNWCVGAGAPCIGCTEPNFPGSSAFYDEEEEEDDDD